MARLPTIARLLANIEEDPENAELYQLLGRAYRKQGSMDKAKAAFERSLELEPDDPFTYLFLGNWYYTEEQYGEAVASFTRAAELMPDSPTPFWCLGDAHAALGRDAIPTENYRRALKNDPNDKVARKRWREWTRDHVV